MNAKKAFTLIELLVVIAIIAILAAILFPVFAQAKLAAKKTADLSNLKNIGTADIMYGGDFDDTFPRADYRIANRQSWSPLTWREATGPYTKNGISNYTWLSTDGSPAPLADGAASIWFSPAAPQGYRYYYAANPEVFTSGESWSIYNGGNTIYADYDSNGNPTGKPAAPSMTSTQMAKPAGTVILTTGGIAIPYGGGANVLQTEYWWQGGGANIKGAIPPKEWDKDGAVVPSYGSYPGDLNGPYNGLPRFRYTNVANATFADGHAKGKQKGGFGFCNDIFVKGGFGNPYGGSATNYDDSVAFNTGNACAGYDQG